MFQLKKMFFRVANATPHHKEINQVGIRSKQLVFNPTIPQLYEFAFLNELPSDPYTKTSFVSQNGALCAFSGRQTSQDYKNSRVVSDEDTSKLVNWGTHNIPIDASSYDLIQNLAVDYINHNHRAFVIDGYAGWDPKYRVKVRTFCTRTYHALFMRNMLITPTEQEFEEDFSKGVDVTIFNAGEMQISKNIPGQTSNMIKALNLTNNRMVILGTQFAGQMKKSVFKMLQYYYPRKNILPLHASATENADGTTTLLCGLTGTGKTALGLRSDIRKIISDDETCWTNEGIFNIGGGSYAKISGLDKNSEPEIYKAIKFGAIIENGKFSENSRKINFNDNSLAASTRAAFPNRYLKNFKQSATGSHPNNVILLTCDAKGILPPVSKLTHEQAYYQFLSGYSTKPGQSGLEKQNNASIFSSCFGEKNLPLHPKVYGKMFYQKIKNHKVNTWLVNTGWTQGKFGVGKRIDFSLSQKIIDAINNGSLNNAEMTSFKHFNFQVPTKVEGVPDQIINPENGWHSNVQYEETLSSLVIQFTSNFQAKFQNSLEDYEEVKKHGPIL